MRRLQTVELALGVAVAALGLATVLVGWFGSYSGGLERVYRNGRLIETHSISSTFPGAIGVRPALAVLATFVVLVSWATATIILHARSREGDGLRALWVATLVLAFASAMTGAILGPLFWPSATLVIACALFSTLRNTILRPMS